MTTGRIIVKIHDNCSRLLFHCHITSEDMIQPGVCILVRSFNLKKKIVCPKKINLTTEMYSCISVDSEKYFKMICLSMNKLYKYYGV